MVNKISTANKIITASIQLFYQKSYTGTTLQDISQSSGASIGSIYHAFPKGKKDIAKFIWDSYQSQNDKELGLILKENAINFGLEQTVDTLIATLVRLGNEFACMRDTSFLMAVMEFSKGEQEQDQIILEYITILLQLKLPDTSRDQAHLKARVCSNIWGSLLSEYDITQDIKILEQIKVITLKYLAN